MRLHGTSAIRNVLDRLAVLSKISPPCFYHRDAIGKERTDVTKNLKEVPFFEKILDQQFFYLHVEIVESPRNSKRKEKWRHHQKNPFFFFFSFLFVHLFVFYYYCRRTWSLCVLDASIRIYIFLRWHPLPSSSNYGQKSQRKRRNTQK